MRGLARPLGLLGALAVLLGARPSVAAPGPAEARVHHVAPAEAEGGEALRLFAVVEDAWVEKALVVRYRPEGSDARFHEAPFERSSTGEYVATIPPDAVAQPGLEYYIAGTAADGHEVDHFASARWPHPVRVEPPASVRWREADLQRIGGRRTRVRMRLEAQDFNALAEFGDRNDRYVRGEADLTYRLVQGLYSFTIGYGFVEGTTPAGMPVGTETRRAQLRYGYGGVRLRFNRAVWLDGAAILGVSENGFITGGRGEFILGQDWRTCVKLGGEYLQDLGGRLWVRLQWDTVPPFLMAAQVTRTGFPDAEITGNQVSFELTYPMRSGLSLVAGTSYGARGRRPGSFGGTLAASWDF